MTGFFNTDVSTTDVEETLSWLQKAYGHVDIQADTASFSERAIGDDDFALRHLVWDCRAEVFYEADRFYVCTSTPGYSWRVGAHESDFSVEPGIIEPGHEMIGLPDRTEIQLLAFDTHHLTEAARAIYGDDALSVRFDGFHPVSRRMRDYYLATLRWSLTQAPLMKEPLVRAHVRRTLVAATLESFPLVGDPRERRASAVEQAAIYAAATVWFDEHASLPVTIDDAAAAVGTSTAGLRRAFAANGQLASTPEDYLALVRLSAAHADLIDADPATTTVAETALRWGFTYAAAFAIAYRSAYRVDAEHTLRR